MIFDLEFTAWEGSMARGWQGEGEHREVVEIGAVRLASSGLEEEAAFSVLVRPRINPLLSDYLQALTGITNEDIARHGVDFAEAYGDFLAFLGDAPAYSYGRDDLVLAENLRLYGLGEPEDVPPARDLRSWLTGQGVDVGALNSSEVAAAVGAEGVGHVHRALDDARSLAAALRALVARGAPSPFL
ncbi:MAG: exonuclease domain-containing protein [Alphaproteobacteria bacterium]|nr:exonuclease domain-containing protein [Alphaproteobacteria bacterium]